jgi:dethiobiotin synthetase
MQTITNGYFVAGTDTGIGKTLVTSALVSALVRQGLRVAGMKPVASGATWIDDAWHNDDVDTLLAVNNVTLPAGCLNAYLLQEPTAPHIAAGKEGQLIELQHIQACLHVASQHAERVIVEGVGGFLVPLNDRHDTGDLACLLGLPVILVVGIRLGCISHALLTIEAIRARGLVLAGWVANIVAPDMLNLEANLISLQSRINAPLLGRIPYLGEQVSASAAAAHLDLALLASADVHNERFFPS